jgi:hypothetical protein
MRYQTTDGHVFPSGAAHLIGASLPTPARCKEAIDLMHEALATGISLAALWQIANTAVWDGLPVARMALGQPQACLTEPLSGDNDCIIFADLDQEDAVPPTPLDAVSTPPIMPAPCEWGNLPLFDC